MALGFPIPLSSVGDRYTKSCVIDCVTIKGFADVGNVFTVSDPVTSELLIDSTGSTLGVGFIPFPSGLSAPNGFQLTAKSGTTFVTTGIVYIYIR